MLKATKEIQKISLDKIFPYTNKFLNVMYDSNKTNIIQQFINELLDILEKGDNFPVLVSLNVACMDASEYINVNRLKKILSRDRIKNFFESHPNMFLKYLVLHANEINIFRDYLKYSNDISILSLPHSRKQDVEQPWIDTVINILSEPASLKDLINKIIKGYTPWIFLNLDSHFGKISKGESKLFITLLKIVKTHWGEFKDIKINKMESLFDRNTTVSFYKVIFNIIKLITYKQNDQIKELKDIEYFSYEGEKIMWYADEPEKVIDLMNQKNEYRGRYIADKLYICSSSALRDGFKNIEPIARTIDLDYYVEAGHFDDTTEEDILKSSLSGEIDFWDLKYYIKHLISKEISPDDIIGEMFKGSVEANVTYGDILYFLYEENKDLVMKAFHESNYLFNSQNLINIVKDSINESNLESFIKAFHKFNIKFKTRYSYSDIINCFEGKYLEVITDLFTNEGRFDRTKLPQELEKLRTKHLGFNAIIDSYIYRLVEEFEWNDQSIINPDYIYTFIENSMWRFKIYWGKISTEEYKNIFIGYLNMNEVFENDIWINHILWYIRFLPWDELKHIINMVPEDGLANQYDIMSLDYKLKEIPSYKEFINTKHYASLLKSFSTWISHIWGYDKKTTTRYDIKLAVSFWKINFMDIDFYPYDFHRTILFLKENDFTAKEIYDICLSIKEPIPGEMIRGIPNPYEEFDGVKHIQNIFSDVEYRNFIDMLSDKNIPITPILIK